ncbi:MAG: NAD(P)H-hydrate dehydratase [Candidatus Omnitrophota bacterium]
MGLVRLPRKFPLLPRKKRTDKSDYGHVLVLAGSKGLSGAAKLASRAALVSGSGLVTLGVPQSLEGLMARALTEVMPLGLPETKGGALSPSAYGKIAGFIKKRKINALAVGPGLSQDVRTGSLVRKLVKNAVVPVVLDADGLNSFRKRVSLLRGRKTSLVLTPHQREFERLFGKPWPENEDARIRLAKKLSRFYDVVLLLKGHRTLVVHGDRVYVNKTGNPGMAKGGTGDVLTGIIASFIAQGLDPFSAAVWAVTVHGRAGDAAAKVKGQLGLVASDLIDHLPGVLKSLE